VRIWRETGEIITEDEFQQRLWAAQNARLDGTKLVNNAIATLDADRVARLGIRRRTVVRRRVVHWMGVLAPCVIALLILMALAILLHQPGAHCEPYQGC
jgi:hypothetical protein